jgi:type I restriction enzyme S subunit
MELSTRTGCLEAARGVIFELAIRGALLDDGSLPPCTTSSTEGTESPVRDTEALFAIPAHWSWTTLEQLGEVQPRNSAPNDAPCGFVPMASISARYGTPVISELRRWGDVRKGYTHLADGDVILAKITPCFENGKSGVVSGLPNGIGAGTTELHVLRPHKDRVVPAFLAIVLKSPGFIRRGVPQMTGSAGQKRVPSSYFSTTPIPLPPLAEQQRIVAKVDELMALCDRLEAQLKQRDEQGGVLAKAAVARFRADPTVENLEYLFHPRFSIETTGLRRSILMLALRGKLVPRTKDTVAASVDFPKLAATSIDEPSDELPVHWLNVPLGECGEWLGGGTPSKDRADYWVGEIPWVSPKDMKLPRIVDSQDHISPAAVQGSSVRLVPSGSVLMVVRGMILARAFPVAQSMREVTINQDMKALVPHYSSCAEFILLAMSAMQDDVLRLVERSSHGTCKLKTEILLQIAVPIPPFAEQRRIVAKVEELMALVDQLESQITASEEAGTKLFDALVAELAPSN